MDKINTYLLLIHFASHKAKESLMMSMWTLLLGLTGNKQMLSISYQKQDTVILLQRKLQRYDQADNIFLRLCERGIEGRVRL